MPKNPVFFILSLLLIAAMAIGGCAAPVAAPAAPAAESNATAPASDEPVTIQVFYPVAVDAPIAQILSDYVEAFQAENPNITVEPVFSGGYGDVKTAIQTTIEGGGKPPALAVMLATDIYDLVNAGYIAPLDEFIAQSDPAYIADFLPAYMANSSYDDQTWSIPFQRSAVVLYYNADLFAEAGIDPPTDWQSWAEAAQALTVRDGDNVTRWGIEFSSDWPYWLFQPLAIGAGQNIVGENPTEVFFDTQALKDALQFYIDLSQVYQATPAGVQANWGAGPSDLASGQTAMIAHSTGSLSGILSQADFEVGVMPYPGKEAGSYASVPGGGNLYVMDGASDAEKAAAWKFIQFLTEPDRVADFSIQTGYIPNRTTAFETQAWMDYVAEVPQAQVAADALQYAQAEFTVENLGQVRTILHDYIHRAINGEMPVADAMAAAQADADVALEIFR
jgi:sn-glycerol 3-phosphate transport system substrate-binding protein